MKFSYIFSFLGICICFFAFLVTIENIAPFVTQDGAIDNTLIKEYFWIFQVIIFLVGIILILNKYYLYTLTLYKKEIILLIIVLGVMLLIVEVVSGMILKYSFSHLAFKNKKISVNNSEFNVTASFDEYGFRNQHDYGLIPSIEIIGDSMVFGVGVEDNETFSAVFESLLNQDKNNVVVYNVGVSDSYPQDYLLYLKEMSSKINPEITIVTVYLGNDFTCEKPYQQYIFPHTRKVLKKITGQITAQQDINLLLKEGNLSEQYQKQLRSHSINPYFFTQVLYKKNLSEEYEMYTDWFNTCEENKQFFLEMNERINETNSIALFVLIPAGYEVSDNNWKELKELGYVLDDSLLVRNELQQIILDFCKKNNLYCIDMLPSLRESNSSVYFQFDTHINKEGHNLIAKGIYTYIMNSTILKNELLELS